MGCSFVGLGSFGEKSRWACRRSPIPVEVRLGRRRDGVSGGGADALRRILDNHENLHHGFAHAQPPAEFAVVHSRLLHGPVKRARVRGLQTRSRMQSCPTPNPVLF